MIEIYKGCSVGPSHCIACSLQLENIKLKKTISLNIEKHIALELKLIKLIDKYNGLIEAYF